MDRVGVCDFELSTQPFTGFKSKPLREMKYREWWEPKSHVNLSKWNMIVRERVVLPEYDCCWHNDWRFEPVRSSSSESSDMYLLSWWSQLFSYWPDRSINSRFHWSSVSYIIKAMKTHSRSVFRYSNNSCVLKLFWHIVGLSIHSVVVTFAWGRQQVV